MINILGLENTKVILVLLFFSASVAEKDVGVFWHLTDFHVDLNYILDNSTRLWGSYEQDASNLVAMTAISHVDAIEFDSEPPDFIIWGGDSAPHRKQPTKGELLATLQYISGHFQILLSNHDAQLIPIVGQWDSWPARSMSPHLNSLEREQWCTELAKDDMLWKSWIDAARASVRAVRDLPEADFTKVCYQSLLLNGKKNRVLILALNSLVWYRQNPKADRNLIDPLHQFDWMVKSLEWARKNEVKVIIVTHFPIGAPPINSLKNFYLHDTYNEKLVEILTKFSDVIITTLTGHTHVDSFKLVLDEHHIPVGSILMGPSVSPRRIQDIGPTNPRIRQYKYDRKAGVILDFVQYYLNLSQPDPVWMVEYEAVMEYSLDNASPDRLARLLDEFTLVDNIEGRWKSYWRHELGGLDHHDRAGLHPGGTCPKRASVCRCELICSARSLTRSKLSKCLEVCHSSLFPELHTIHDMIRNARTNASTVVSILIVVILSLTLVAVVGLLVYRKYHSHGYHHTPMHRFYQ
ncbi:Sphingomyelin phosphodiesterase [Paragonimus heterotremus]|uniref:Sphingomyelin phosphodiesterase n=1 Tax=Paragonimus heterotremus TaxID=100268 RepID=A0A8J4TFA9_9TREM|nr:Sphingomyelin phosphodiesterase [Paragonimus heterotremus]